jgi:hypothetical protein
MDMRKYVPHLDSIWFGFLGFCVLFSIAVLIYIYPYTV